MAFIYESDKVALRILRFNEWEARQEEPLKVVIQTEHKVPQYYVRYKGELYEPWLFELGFDAAVRMSFPEFHKFLLERIIDVMGDDC